MRKLDKKRRAAVLAASSLAIIPSLMLSARGAHTSSIHTRDGILYILAGILTGVLVGTAFRIFGRGQGLCTEDEAQ